MCEGDVMPARTSDGDCIPELLSWIEEADLRLMVHVEWSAPIKKSQRIIVLSNDADTFAILLYHMPHFKSLGVKELWLQYGTGENKNDPSPPSSYSSWSG